MNLRHSVGILAEKAVQLCQHFLWQAVAVQKSPGKKAATKGLQGNQAVGVKEKTSLEGGISGLIFAPITN